MAMFRPPADYMMLKEIAQLLRCSSVTIWKYRNAFDDFPAPVLFRRRLLFERGAVMAWCRRHIEDYNDGASQELTAFDEEFEAYERDCINALRERCREVVEDALQGCDAIREQVTADLTAAVHAEVARCIMALDLRSLVRQALEEVVMEELSLPTPRRSGSPPFRRGRE